MSKAKVFKFYADPGHGWVAVKRALLVDLGIENKITQFSYTRGATAYLEEDCDALTFERAYTERHGIKPEYTESHANDSSPIRSYDRYTG